MCKKIEKKESLWCGEEQLKKHLEIEYPKEEGMLYVGDISDGLRTPEQLIWNPKEDITTYELAMCMPYIIHPRSYLHNMIDESEPHFRHFKIIKH